MARGNGGTEWIETDGHRRLVDKARALGTFCVEHGFEGISVLAGMKVGYLTTIYDGIGPNWSFSVVAEIIDHISLDFEPAGFLLDVQYRTLDDRSEEAFHRCNLQFYHNCVKCAKAKHGWWSLARYRLIRSAKVLYEACEEHGLESWNRRGIFPRQ